MNKVILPILLIMNAMMVSATTDIINGSIEKKSYEFDDFDQLTLNGAFEVTIIQGEREEVILEGPDYILDDIKVTQRGPKVIVGDHPYKNKSVRKISVTVYVRTLHKLEINGISRLECATPLQSDHLDLYCNGIRNVEFDLDVEDLTATFDGIGSTYLTGVAARADIECAGMGNLYASELRVGILHFESAGIGKAEVYADKELYVDAAGIGSVRYAGDPEVKSISKDGIGRVKAMY